ncbi:DNA-binding protein [Duck adenovirus 1]|uniref:DNA-binding protein n=5 Tax=Duck atadenovirus A TaxID=130328 RepID=O11422_DADV1|nr:DNA-binding protein [Duck atadenovirus A]AP_000090.1 DBP [Duck atadenovirus A]AGS11276.1 DNA-binding protein [Duck adenovirus 1]AJA72366.1 DNA-binding protein [Duck adenovirus 1]AJA72395.1 DNA-binding protein [Duck adenovirus 1]AJA72424.1 DNA-binding protein [Duck adenovirus 1]QOS14192.1 DNA-binding protein [Duck atadenovirus A]
MSSKKSTATSSKKAKRSAGLTDTELERQQNESLFQAALEVVYKLGEHLKVETKDVTFHPFDTGLEKLFAQTLKKAKYTPIYSAAKSMNVVGGRLLYGAICNYVGLAPNFNPTGCSLWEHGWEEGVRCYHSEKMILKENIIEMTPTSEAAISALKEGRGLLSSNKYGKQVVRIVQENSMICPEDLRQTRFGTFSNSSCGLNFTDGEKAKLAYKNATAYIQAVFPKTAMQHLLFIVTACECNYGGQLILGKQIPKMTPYTVSGVENISVKDLDPVKAVGVKYPAVFVFQCCNFQGQKRAGNAKSCEFKISLPDLIHCLITARNLWFEVMGEPMPVQFPLFKWSPALQVKNTLLPSCDVCTEDNPFGEIPTKRKRVVEIESDEDEEEDED